MKVLFLPEVVDQFLELANILYEKGYLGFKDAALNYSEQLFRDIQTNLPTKTGKDVVNGETVYLVRHLTNNHVAAHHLDLEI